MSARSLHVFFALVLSLTSAGSFAQNNWNGGTGNWSSAGNWSLGNVPTINNDTTICSDGADYVILDTIGSAKSLQLGGPSNGYSSWLIDGGNNESLTIANALNVGANGYIGLTGGTSITAGADSTNAGQIELWNGSSLSITGNMDNFGVLQPNSGGSTINVTGVVTNEVGGSFVVTGGGTSNIGSINNQWYTFVGSGTTLNLTNQPGGITNVVPGASFWIQGTVNDVITSANGFANVQNIGGQLFLQNGQTTTITPGTGMLVVGSVGWFDVSTLNGVGTTANIDGNVDNSASFLTSNFESFYTNYGGGNSVNVSGTFTNNSGGALYMHGNYFHPDVVNVGNLVNNSYVFVGPNAFLNLTNQPGGITDVALGASFQIQGTVTDVANSANGFANLQSIEGGFRLQNGQVNSITPGNGTLSITGGSLDVSTLNGVGTTVNINGNVDNNGLVTTAGFESFNGNYGGGNTLNVSGLFTNEFSTGSFVLNGNAYHPDVVNVGSLNNMGYLFVGPNASLNLTNQPGGITDVVANSTYVIQGTFTNQLTGASAFAGVNTVEGGGGMQLQNGQTTVVTPVGGTFTVNTWGYVEANYGSTLQINGDAFNNSTLQAANGGTVQVNGNVTNTAYAGTAPWGTGGAHFNVTGTLYNPGYFPLNNPGDSATIGNLVNQGAVYVGPGAKLDPMRVDNYSWIGVSGTMIVDTGTPSGPGYYQFANGTLGEHIDVSQAGAIGVDTNGAVSLNGTLDVQLAPGFIPSVGSSYRLFYFTPGDLTGTFASILNRDFNNGADYWVVDYNNASGYVSLTAEPVPEPASILLLGTGLLGLSYRIRRKLSR